MDHGINVDELKRVSIIDLAQKVGFKIVRRGPQFTTEEHPSLILYPKDNSWHRYSTSDGGDAIAFLMYWRGLDFKRACEQLENLAGVLPAFQPSTSTPKPPPPELAQDLADHYHQALRPEDWTWWACQYGVSETAIRRFRLGVCREGRFAPVTYTIPIFQDGKLVNIKHRIPNAPHNNKYRNHQAGVGTQLFNGDRLTPDCKGVVVVAGEMKAIVLEDWDVPAISATGGCGNWRPEWTARLAACDRIYVAYDPEPPEERKHAVHLLEQLDTRGHLVDCPHKPDDFILERGVAEFRDLLRQARTLAEIKAWDAALVKARRTVRI